MRSRKVWIAVAVLLAGSAVAGRARAQWAPLVSKFPVEIEGGRPDVSVQISAPDMNLPCGAHCVLELPEGRYRVVATGADGHPSTNYLDVGGPSHVTVTPHSHAARVTGFVLMPAGIAGVGTGVVLLWWWLFKTTFLRLASCDSDCSSREFPGWLIPTAFISLGAGLAVGGTGLYLWRSNAHADVRVRSLRMSPGATRLQLRPAAGPRWMGLALGGSF